MFSFIKNLIKRKKVDYKDLIERGALIIDVRTPQEFAQGHVKDSINIPLSELNNRILEIRKKEKPVITCCRSGARAVSATANLKGAGIETYNGGSWNAVEHALNNVVV